MRASDDQFDPNDPAEQALDRLLQQARWHEPSPQQKQRVRDGWLALSHRRRIMPPLWTAAAAAVVLVVGGAATIVLRQSPVVQPHSEKFFAIVTDEPKPADLVRPATAYEKLALISATRTPSRQAATPIPLQTQPPVPSIAQLQLQVRNPASPIRGTAIHAMLKRNDHAGMNAYLNCLNDPSLQDQAMAVLVGMSDPPREALLNELNNPIVANRQAAAQALGAICNAELVERLGEMVESNINRREALAALLAAKNASAMAMLDDVARRHAAVKSQIQALKSETPDITSKEPGNGKENFYRAADSLDRGDGWIRIGAGATTV